jgi:hypothetical protein
MKRSPRSNAGKSSPAALERVFRDNVRREYALRLELRELEQADAQLAHALGLERADALALEERVRWQRDTGRCHLCLGPCDDHPDIEPWPRRDEEPR